MTTDARQAALAPKPAHVPDALVYDFDYFQDPGLQKDPHGRVLEILEKAPPIFWTPRKGGAWIAMGHEANFEAARNFETFSNELIPLEKLEQMKAAMPPGAPHIPLALPIAVDPPLHGKYRLPLNSAFSPKAINGLKGDIRVLARELVRGIADKGGCEFMSEVAEPLPVNVFLKMFGLPVERQAEYRALVKEHLATIQPDAQQSLAKLQNVAAVMRQTFLDRRENPKDDLISNLWRSTIDGEPTNLEDMENWGVVLFIAGLDTVMNGIGFGVRHLATDLELQERLRTNPELTAEAAEELLRRYTFTVPPRVVVADTTFQGVEMKAGDRLLLFLAGADLDHRRFQNPAQYDLDREDKVHIAFGAGPHRCLGSHLARIELQIVYEELLAGLPQFGLDPEKPPTFHGGHVLGLDSLHLVWDV
jgi:cytochrome P450